MKRRARGEGGQTGRSGGKMMSNRLQLSPPGATEKVQHTRRGQRQRQNKQTDERWEGGERLKELVDGERVLVLIYTIRCPCPNGSKTKDFD